jgi:hypothetical protein
LIGVVRGGEPDNSMAGVYGGPQSVFRVCKGMQEAYINPLISPSLLSFLQFSYTASCQRRISRPTPNHFYALEMATFAFKPYIYVLTAPRSKSTATRRKPAPEQISILNKL